MQRDREFSTQRISSMTSLIEWWIKWLSSLNWQGLTVSNHQYNSQKTALQHLDVTPIVSPSKLWLFTVRAALPSRFHENQRSSDETLLRICTITWRRRHRKLQWYDKCNLNLTGVHSRVWDWCHHADGVGDDPIVWMDPHVKSCTLVTLTS